MRFVIDIGFGYVLRVAWLKAHPKRRHVFGPHRETRDELMARHDKALALLEARKDAWLAGDDDLSGFEKRIRALGFMWLDEPDVEDGRYSYWRVK